MTRTAAKKWLEERNINLKEGFTEELYRLAAAYKKTTQSIF